MVLNAFLSLPVPTQAIRVLGLLGALDPYKHKVNIGMIDQSRDASAVSLSESKSSQDSCKSRGSMRGSSRPRLTKPSLAGSGKSRGPEHDLMLAHVVMSEWDSSSFLLNHSRGAAAQRVASSFSLGSL